MGTTTAEGMSRSFLAGLFFITSATLLLEILNTRLLSVVTWYHLSFFAVSMAMFGMAAGALWVYLKPQKFPREDALSSLYRYSILFALSTLICHLVILFTPLSTLGGWDAANFFKMTLITLAVAIPFAFSGVVITVALTQVPGNSGLIYAVDLVGAALGSLACLALLSVLDISSATIASTVVTVLAILFFQRAKTGRSDLRWVALAVVLAIGAFANSQFTSGLRVFYPKGNEISYSDQTIEYWTIHGQILLSPAEERVGPFYWGAGAGAPVIEGMKLQGLVIDGEAGTAVTQWDGNREGLEWPRFDVTSLPYHLRKEGNVAVIGVGGGRDILTALWAKSKHITGIEINGAILDILQDRRRDFVSLDQQPEVEFVHDEARSFLTRSDETYDVIQMSLIDTWAATGAGAFTLSVYGLYTVEGWQIFFDKLAPNGLLSVSRWYSPEALSETNRLISLAAMSLLEQGVDNPGEHAVLVARNTVATLLVSPTPFSDADLDQIESVAAEMAFTVLHSPRQESSERLIRDALASKSSAQLEAATQHEFLDFSPPLDSRPYFFNILKPSALLSTDAELGELGIVAGGNLLATYTLMLLCLLAFIGVTLVIGVPLLLSGKPQLPKGVFGSGLLYFACIGTGFMMVQIPLIQRFSVYLGHPVYAVSVLLFSMIIAAGLGSSLSDRIAVERDRRWTFVLPLTIVAMIIALYLLSGPIIQATIDQGLLVRCLIVILLVAAAALPMGMCFPLGLRLFRQYSDDCLPWLWGVNGATGVLASVLAVAISMWSGINSSLLVAIGCYALLIVPARALSKQR
ncbi:MAG TPA: hypothetical protein DCS79_04255 [Gammaproteobacteria bacterium]|nr:hypothetical protein [Gammaproteobacteria bacterium]